MCVLALGPPNLNPSLGDFLLQLPPSGEVHFSLKMHCVRTKLNIPTMN